MSVRLAVAAYVSAGFMMSCGGPVHAQADIHARALARASCQSGKHSEAVIDAHSAVDHNPEDLGPRMRLADALVDQGCYPEAVEILETASEIFPRNAELSGKLRDVRSLVTEQTYIEGLTQAAEGAKLARNQLRCTKLGDVTACQDALSSKPDDVQLLLAQGDALMQANRPTEAATAYRHLAQLKPGDESIEAKLANAQVLAAKDQPPVPSRVAAANPVSLRPPKVAKKPAAVAASRPSLPAKSATAQPNGGQHLTATPTAAVAALSPPEPKTYSNEAPPGQTN